MEKTKVFVPCHRDDFNAVITGISYSGVAKEQEGYFFTEEEKLSNAKEVAIDFCLWYDSSQEAYDYTRSHKVYPEMGGSHNEKIKKQFDELFKMYVESK